MTEPASARPSPSPRPAAGGTILVLRLEGLAAAIVATVLYRLGGGDWSRFALLILAPDLFMLGYLAGPKAGAFCYNLVHSYAAPALLGLAGLAAGSASLPPVALIWAAHIGADRALGFGLKHRTGFRFTHLN